MRRVLVALLALAVGPAWAAETGIFGPPAMQDDGGVTYRGEDYVQYRSGLFDTDMPEDGVAETLLIGYQCACGRNIIRFSTPEGLVWGWAYFGAPGVPDEAVQNYVLIDSDGDGVFDSKLAGNEGIARPAYLAAP